MSFNSALRRWVDVRAVAASDGDAIPSVDVTVLLSQDGDRLYVESIDSADAPVAECWATSFLHLLTCMANQPDAPILGHPLTGNAERHRLLHDLNPGRDPQIRHRMATGPFEEQVERTPDAIALIDHNGTTVTYQELDRRANRLAHYLRANGAGPCTRIGIWMERSIHQVVAIYAAVKSGSAYIPLDPELPDLRLAYMLGDSAPLHVLTDRVCRDRVPVGAWRILDIDSDGELWSALPATKPVAVGTPGALLHILYTSGTTGHPKGVAYPTGGALANLSWMQHRYPYREGDCAVLKTSPGFDVSIWELFWPLYHGARLAICCPGGHKDPKRLARFVEEHGVSTIFLVPTVATPFLENISSERAGLLRWVVCGGESMSTRIRDRFYAVLPGSTLVNAYGPTEAGPVTDNIVPSDQEGLTVPVGRPAGNFRLNLLDENLDLVPMGMPGEAYISGALGLAHGYWRAPARTAERFVPDPHGPPGSRMYRTGDLCRYCKNGALEHLGRIDRQLKIRGQRVEPGEIESVLAAHPAVTDCAVIPHGEPARLIAFIVRSSHMSAEDKGAADVRDYAAKLLPDHMRPEQVLVVPRIPSTVNGKVDKGALIQVWLAHDESGREIVRPTDELEARVAEIYCRVLNASQVSMLDTFRQLGGHSLLAFQLLDECREQLQVKPDVTRLLTGTVRDLADLIRAGRVSDGSPMAASSREA